MSLQNILLQIRDGYAAGMATAVLAAAPVTLLAGDDTVVRPSEPVEATSDYETFGSLLPDEGETHALSTVLSAGNDYLGREFKATARVAQVCQVKGCFFIAQDGPFVARISFQDYSFFVPSDISGRMVTLAGRLKVRDLSAQQAEHYNADIGDPKALKPGQQYEIVATSVRVPRG